MAKYFFIAGEVSGDLHGAKLIKALRQKDRNAEISAWGGDRMKEAGAKIEKHISELAIMGFGEVVAKLPEILRNFSTCKQNIKDFNPDAVILIDYAGFNLRIAKYAKKQGIKVFFYIAPKVWAWRKSRIRKLKAYVDKLFVIFPFEKDFFAAHGLKVEYVGNPLIERMNEFRPDDTFMSKLRLPPKYIALLPGSRKQEIDKIMPCLLALAQNTPDENFVIAGLEKAKPFLEHFSYPPNIKIIYDNTYNIIYHAHSAVVTSGTATLETALLACPQVVVYKTSKLTYRIANMLVDKTYLKHISLVNIIAGTEVVKELIQEECNTGNLSRELQNIHYKEDIRENILKEYKLLRGKMGNNNTSGKIASYITEHLLPRD